VSSKSKEGKAAQGVTSTAPSKAVSIIPSSEGPSSKVVEDVHSSRQGAAVADQVRWKGVVCALLGARGGVWVWTPPLLGYGAGCAS
jgi:hypothetical protein